MPRPSKCHTCGLMVGTMPIGWKCERTICTNPLGGPEAKCANRLEQQRQWNRRLTAKGYHRKRYRKNKEEGRRKSREWSKANPLKVREMNRRWRSKLTNRAKLNRKRAERYRSNPQAQFTARRRALSFARDRKWNGWARRQFKDGSMRWIPPTDPRATIPWQVWRTMQLREQESMRLR